MKYIFFIVLLVLVIITAGCVQPGPATSKVTPTPTAATCNYANEIVGYDSCNGICWDWETQTCCGGTIYNTKFTETVCCGGKVYPYQSGWDCCPDTFLKRWINDTQDNSQVWFNTSTDHCCGGKVTSGGGLTGWYGTTKQWQDCGNSCYDTGTQSCCQGWDSNANKSVKIVKQGKDSCCKDLPYPLSEDQQCNIDGSITRKSGSSICDSFGQGSAACYNEKQNSIRENARLICPSCSGY